MVEHIPEIVGSAARRKVISEVSGTSAKRTTARASSPGSSTRWPSPWTATT